MQFQPVISVSDHDVQISFSFISTYLYWEKSEVSMFSIFHRPISNPRSSEVLASVFDDDSLEEHPIKKNIKTIKLIKIRKKFVLYLVSVIFMPLF